MAMTLKPGTRIFSDVCAAELIVVKAPDADVDLTVGGVDAVTSADDRTGTSSIVDGHGGGVAMGKRYVDEADTVELLCTKPGDGVPAVAGEILQLKQAKALPASD